LPAAFAVWAVACYRAPLMSGALLGLAAGTIFFPVLLFPVWLRFYWRHGALRFVSAYLIALSLGIGVTLLGLWSVGLFPDGLTRSLHLADWQPWKAPQSEGLWQGVHWAYRLPVFILYIAFLLTLFVWPPVKTLAHVVSLSAAVLIGIQFWYAERGGMYVLWYLPLLIVMTLRPTTGEIVTPLSGGVRSRRWFYPRWDRIRRPSDSDPPVLAG